MSRFKFGFSAVLRRPAVGLTIALTAVLTQGCEKVGFEVVKKKFTLTNEAPVVLVPSPLPSVIPSPRPSPSPSPKPSPKPSPTPTMIPSPKPSPKPSPSPSPTPKPSPKPSPSPTPVACKAGPEIRVVAGVTSTSLTATFHGEEISGISYQILNSTGVAKGSGTFAPSNNHPDISYSPIEPGNYKLVFKATNCVGGSSLDFVFDPSLVCDPFGKGSTSASRKTGIEAKLTYLPADTSVIGLKIEHFMPGAPNVTVSPGRIILSDLNVPSRKFSAGFMDTNSGKRLKNENGDNLDEFFSLQAAASLRLDQNDAEGEYELAVISDDGTIVDLDPSGEGKSYTRWIDNDGTHGNQMGCSTRTLNLSHTSEIPMKLNYYQGPREQIALMLIWRLKNASAVEPECGLLRADDYFFNVNGSSSVATSNFSALQARGWKVLGSDNFVLPNSQSNPCMK